MFLGDSRVHRLRRTAESMSLPPGWEAQWLAKNGAHLGELVSLLKDAKKKSVRSPKFIVVVAFLVDAVKLQPCEEKREGKKLLWREEIDAAEGFPALPGFKRKVRDVWHQLKSVFPEAKIIWTTPHPVDALRWRHERGMKSAGVLTCMTFEEHNEYQTLSYRLHDYFRNISGLIEEEFGSGYWLIPWVVFWCKAQGRGLDLDGFLKACRDGDEVGFFNCRGSEDGMHPSTSVCQGMLKSVFGRMRAEYAPAKPRVPAKMPPLKGPEVHEIIETLPQKVEVEEPEVKMKSTSDNSTADLPEVTMTKAPVVEKSEAESTEVQDSAVKKSVSPLDVIPPSPVQNPPPEVCSRSSQTDSGARSVHTLVYPCGHHENDVYPTWDYNEHVVCPTCKVEWLTEELLCQRVLKVFLMEHPSL